MEGPSPALSFGMIPPMRRRLSARALLTVVSFVALASTSGSDGRAQTPASPQEKPSPSPDRPPVEIPFARLKPDAVLALSFEPGAAASPDAVWVRGSAAG